MTDIIYIDQGLFFTLLPESDSGVKVWNELAVQNGGNVKLFHMHAKQLIAQLRSGGYKVTKRKPFKVNADKLLAELGI